MQEQQRDSFVEYQPDPTRIRQSGGQISHILPNSIADELGLQPGDTVLAVNGLTLRDVIDYRFAIADEECELLVHTSEGDILYDIQKDDDEDLGIEFVEPLFDRLRTCNNKCPFCFLTQMPKGMRKTLYLKDDDYRLSFLYGNFVTMTNLTEEDWQRIEQQRLSPLYLSIHATDRALRAILLGKQDVPDVLDQIGRLAAANIEVHTQIVACPGLNDAAALERTIEDLAAFWPTVASIAVVPVGLTRFRFNGKAPQSIRTAIQVHETPEWIDTNWERQPAWNDNQPAPPAGSAPGADWGFCARMGAATDVPLRCYTSEEAADVIERVLPYQQRFQRQLGSGLVYPSDEFYLLCERPLPPAGFYDDFAQYSNGVGMTRDFLDGWANTHPQLPERVSQTVRVALVCGTLIAPVMQQVVDRLNQIDGLQVRLLPVVNEFFGPTVTVSGLLMGQDVIEALRTSGCEQALLPRVMFDHQGTRTLDEYSPQQIAEEADLTVRLAGDADDIHQYVWQLVDQTTSPAAGDTISAAA